MEYYNSSEIYQIKNLILDSIHFAYSFLPEQEDIDQETRNILVECYESELEKRYFLLSTVEFILESFRKSKKLSNTDYLTLTKKIKKWILDGWEPGSTASSNNIDNIDQVLYNYLNQYGLLLEDVDISEKDKLTIKTNSEFKYWKTGTKPVGKYLRRKEKADQHVIAPSSLIYHSIDTETRPLRQSDPQMVHQIQYPDKDPKITKKGAMTKDSRDVMKRVKKQEKYSQDSVYEVRKRDYEVFDQIFSYLNETSNNVKESVKKFWDEILRNSKKSKRGHAQRGNIRNRELYQLYIIKLVKPSYTYYDLYNAYINIDSGISPEKIYNVDINTPSDQIHKYMSNFFQNPPKKIKIDPERITAAEIGIQSILFRRYPFIPLIFSPGSSFTGFTLISNSFVSILYVFQLSFASFGFSLSIRKGTVIFSIFIFPENLGSSSYSLMISMPSFPFLLTYFFLSSGRLSKIQSSKNDSVNDGGRATNPSGEKILTFKNKVSRRDISFSESETLIFTGDPPS
jgi:hypothetical protein